MLDGKSAPYPKDKLDRPAIHGTEAEDAANKVERQVGKSVAALLLEAHIGERFDAIVAWRFCKTHVGQVTHRPA